MIRIIRILSFFTSKRAVGGEPKSNINSMTDCQPNIHPQVSTKFLTEESTSKGGTCPKSNCQLAGRKSYLIGHAVYVHAINKQTQLAGRKSYLSYAVHVHATKKQTSNILLE